MFYLLSLCEMCLYGLFKIVILQSPTVFNDVWEKLARQGILEVAVKIVFKYIFNDGK